MIQLAVLSLIILPLIEKHILAIDLIVLGIMISITKLLLLIYLTLLLVQLLSRIVVLYYLIFFRFVFYIQAKRHIVT